MKRVRLKEKVWNKIPPGCVWSGSCITTNGNLPRPPERKPDATPDIIAHFEKARRARQRRLDAKFNETRRNLINRAKRNAARREERASA